MTSLLISLVVIIAVGGGGIVRVAVRAEQRRWERRVRAASRPVKVKLFPDGVPTVKGPLRGPLDPSRARDARRNRATWGDR